MKINEAYMNFQLPEEVLFELNRLHKSGKERKKELIGEEGYLYGTPEEQEQEMQILKGTRPDNLHLILT